MTSGTTLSVAPLNGNADHFYDQLLQLRDEVFADRHPRIKLAPSAAGLAKPTPPSVQTTAPAAINQPASGSTTPARSTPSQPFARQDNVTIDPVLLTKSEHLIEAERQLKRRHIERHIKDQVDGKSKSREKEPTIEESRIDVEVIMTKALELVKPISGLRAPTENNPASDSFDENSYYSSKADSWSSEAATSEPTLTGRFPDSVVLPPQTNPSPVLVPSAGPSTARNDTSVQGPEIIDIDEDPYEPEDAIVVLDSPNGQEAEDESEYSPPPAEVGPSGSNRSRMLERGVEERSNDNGSVPSLGSARQIKYQTTDLYRSRRHSPTGVVPPIRLNKRKRYEERREKREGKRRADRQAAASPEPEIKDEPVSPPPFQNIPEAPPNKRRALPPASIDVGHAPVHPMRVQPVYYRGEEPIPRNHRSQYDEPLSPSVVQIAQPQPQRRLVRDDQDLRRVASLQHARRPYSPMYAEPVAYAVPETRPLRAASHSLVEHVIDPVSREIREVSVHPYGTVRLLRERSRSPVYETPRRPLSPTLMPPPGGRIVVDEYGRRFRASPVFESAPPLVRRPEPEVLYERPRSDFYEEPTHRMAPPPPRRRLETVEAEISRPREYSLRPLESVYPTQRQGLEQNRMIRYEEMGPPRQYVSTRAYSVRPEAVLGEVAGEYVQRHESVQPTYVRVAPQYREVSLMAQEPYEGRRRFEEGTGRGERPTAAATVEYAPTQPIVSRRH